MKKRNAYIYIILFILAIAGWFIGEFTGGIVTGFCICMMLLAAIGFKQAAKIEKNMNKRMRDNIVQNS